MKVTYKIGAYVYYTPTGEIVKILGNTKKPGLLTDKYLLEVYSIKYNITYSCASKDIKPLNDKNIQLIMKMVYDNKKFSIIKQL